jgi:NDP-sugar pyrophosphorylase family protein
MNGMLLAAGRGERMAPLSDVVAKPALEVLGQPLLASSFAALRAAGCRRIVANLHRHAPLVASAARAASAGTLAFSWEPTLLGGAGGVAAARPLLGDGPVLVANADVWADLDLSALAATADDGAALGVLPHPDPARWSSVVLEQDGTVAAFVAAGTREHRPRFLFTGFQVLGANVVRELPPGRSEMSTLWDSLRRRGALRGVVVSGRWREASDPAAYRDLVLGRLADASWVHPQAIVAADARLDESAVGAGCRVGAGATVVASVLTAGACVGAGVALERCIVAGGRALAAPAPVCDALILPGHCTPLPR